MKVLIIGSEKIWALEKVYMRYIEKSFSTHLYDAHGKFYDFYSTFFNKIKYRLGVSGVLSEINDQIIQLNEKEKYDVVWVWKGMEIFPDTLRKLKKSGVVLVNYNPDNPFVFSGRGSGNINVTKSISLYDLHFSYDTTVKRKIEADYSIPCLMLPFGYDISDELYQQCVEENEIVKACFLGTPDYQRAEFINSLVTKGVEIDLYGNGWKKFINVKGATVYDAVYGDDFWKVLRKYRVQLNIMRLHNPTSHNMRSFEVPAIGGIMLAPNTIDHRTYFNPGEEVFLYSDMNECISNIHKLLNSSSDQIVNLRAKARSKSVKAGYSYKNRASFVMNELTKIVEQK